MNPLGLLNFVVLQWFGVRLAKVEYERVFIRRTDGTVLVDDEQQPGWTILRWVWPLTGWWSDFRWIARRS